METTLKNTREGREEHIIKKIREKKKRKHHCKIIKEKEVERKNYSRI